MKKLLHSALWTAVFLAMLIVFDQAMVRIPMRTPLLAQGRDFYLEFRERLTHPPRRPVASGEGKERSRSPGPSSSGPRYVYVDKDGAIQFADSLEEVPRRFRKEARPIER